MPGWLVILLIAVAAIVVFAVVWWSSGRAQARRYVPMTGAEAERIRRAGMIETDDLPSRSGFGPLP
jgi:Flp pilus assembly protein CpaB